MRNWRDVTAAIHRLGKKATIYTRETAGSDEFNNPDAQWVESGTVTCVRTYPNRNTEVENPGGPRDRDRPVFIFRTGEHPESGTRIEYNGVLYELESPTIYDSHVAIFGQKV